MKEQPLSENQIKEKVVCFTSEPWSSALAEIRLKEPLAAAGFQVIQGNNLDSPLVEDLAGVKFVVIQRSFHRYTQLFSHVIEQVRKYKIRLIYEIDSLPFDLPDEGLDSKGTYRQSFELMLLALNSADLVTTSTQAFANFLFPFHPDIQVLPSYLPDSIWGLQAREQKTNAQDTITIGYVGGATDSSDLKMIVGGLATLLKQYGPRIMLKLWGANPPGELSAHPQVEWHSPIDDYREFAQSLVSQKIDIFIAPQKNTPLLQFMSPMRFLEHSAMGIPGVYSKVISYEDLVINGENGFLASSLDEWVSRLRTLIESPDLRKQMGMKAQDGVIKDQNLVTHAYKWVNAYYGPLKSREELTITSQSKRKQEELNSPIIPDVLKMQALERRFSQVTNPMGWQVFLFLRRMRNTLFGIGGRRTKTGRFIQEKFHLVFAGMRIIRTEGWSNFLQKFRGWSSKRIESILNNSYEVWIENNEPKPKNLHGQQQEALQLAYKPKISIITPVWNSEIKWLELAIESVIKQTYANWELCIANGSSDSENICKLLNKYAKQDQRIKILHLEKNLGIAANTNAALTLATGDFVGFLDHDDVLAPFALFDVVKVITENSKVDMLYSDEDKITANGRKRYDPFFKPAFSPDFIRSINYIAHFLVVRRKIGNEIGWIRAGFEGAQDYDLVLRVAEKAKEIAHIPRILYHWRAWAGSTALTSNAKDYATESGIKAVKEHLQRMGFVGSVVEGPARTTYKTTYRLARTPLISIIIPNMDHANDLRRCVQSVMKKSSYKNFEILIIENNSRDEATFVLYQDLQQYENVRVIQFDSQPFSFSAINNYAVNYANGEILLFMNNDIEVINSDWLERMIEHIVRPEVGIVGAKLYYPDDTIQHAGVVLGVGGTAGHAHKYFQRTSPGYFTRAILPQNFEAVTAACLMIKKDIFEGVLGFDPTYQLAFGDIDLCMKVRDKGLIIVWTPYSELYHSESKTRGYEDTDEKKTRADKEAGRFRQKWAAILDRGDEYYNPNLTLESENFGINPNPVNVSVRIKPGFVIDQAGPAKILSTHAKGTTER
jgi:glycosyltransferase involved in cell wall biosynthesis